MRLSYLFPFLLSYFLSYQSFALPSTTLLSHHTGIHHMHIRDMKLDIKPFSNPFSAFQIPSSSSDSSTFGIHQNNFTIKIAPEIIALGITFAIVYGSSLLGSLICSIGNLTLLQSQSISLLQKWGIIGIVFGSVALGLGGLYFGLAFASNEFTVPLIFLSLSIVLGGSSLGLGINSFLRAKKLLSDKQTMTVIPWFASGDRQSLISGLAVMGNF